MDKSVYVQALKNDSERFGEVAGQDLTARVPGCPAWTVGDLMLHLGGVYEWVIAVLRSPSRERSDIEAVYERVDARRKERAGSGMAHSIESVSWFEGQARALIDELAKRSPSEPVWTWWDPDQTAGFWQRRMAQETAMHLWDVQDAFAMETPIERGIAADGIDEALFVHLPAEYEESPPEGRGELYHFHCNDGDGEWLVHFTAGSLTVTREHAKGDLAFSGTASDLLLFLWRRIPPENISVWGYFGNGSILRAPEG